MVMWLFNLFFRKNTIFFLIYLPLFMIVVRFFKIKEVLIFLLEVNLAWEIG